MNNIITSQPTLLEDKLVNVDKLYYFLKRSVDLLLVIPSIILLGPMFLILWLWIRLDSEGPVIFVQERVGAKRVFVNGRWIWQAVTFPMFKFRTMKIDSTSKLHQEYIAAYIAGDEARMAEISGKKDDSYKLTNDPRVTSVGRILRKLSLDELPQLWNVIRGEMSLVGPRPPIPYEVELYKPHHMARLAAMPGITGWWQVSGRAATKFEDMVELDVEYIQKQSIWLDLKIMFLTIPAAIAQKGAG
ncbi:MAG: sugar transferase [Anaerolineales bacterium]|nr:sugar transferase [Anaerolineales bacterium]MCA9930023.1 sugar transferase [Anaerolineales bacterium]